MKTTHIIIALLFATALISCDTDIPDTDTTPPTFRFEISGDGFTRAFTEEDNFEDLQLNLKSNATYDIVFSGGDQGGMRRLQMELPEDYVDFQSDIDSPWQTNTSGLTKTIFWNGDADNPITGFVFTGRFIASGESIITSFYLRAEDYGGQDGPPFNITEGTLNILIADQETAVINL